MGQSDDSVGVGIMAGTEVQDMKLHKAKLERTEDGRWTAKIETLPGCEVSADTQGEALVALRKAAEARVDFRDVRVRVKVPEEGIHIPRELIEGVEEMDIIVQGDNRVIATPVIDYEARYKARGWKKGEKSFADEYRGFLTLREDDPDPRYQYLIQKYLRIEKENP